MLGIPSAKTTVQPVVDAAETMQGMITAFAVALRKTATTLGALSNVNASPPSSVQVIALEASFVTKLALAVITVLLD